MKLLSLALFLCASLAHADQFLPDLGDSPKQATTGYMVAQGAVLGGIACGGKKFLDENGAGPVDFMPGLALLGMAALVHSLYWQEGGRNSSLALQEQAWETGGISIGMAL